MDKPLYWLTTAELADAFRSGKCNSVTATQAMLERIDKFDPQLNSYVSVLNEQALASANHLDEELATGCDRGPLHGIPIAVKDIFAVAGLATAAGTEVLTSLEPASQDAAVIARLRAAGAVLLGTLALTEGALSTYHPTNKIPVNPWDPSRWTGVSSSGAGVATAAGMCFGALGTDTGGSIRFPAAANGVVGIKPTFGLVPTSGTFPLCPSMDHVGPLARSVQDAATLLAVIADTNVLAHIDTSAAALSGLRIGIDEKFAYLHTDSVIVDRIMACAVVLEQAGAVRVEVTVPEWEKVQSAWSLLCAVEAVQAHKPFYPARRVEYGEEFAAFLDMGRTVTGPMLSDANFARTEFSLKLQQLFRHIDILFCPAMGVPVPPRLRDPEHDKDIPSLMRFTAPFNAAGNPALVLPCGVAADGMPLSLQMVAAHGRESTLISAAHAFEQATAWHTRHPSIAQCPT
ncbi:MAG: amidase [Pseudomonadales bacterium]